MCHENVLTINGAAAAGDFTQDMVDRVPARSGILIMTSTPDKICYGDDDKHCTGLFKDLEEAPPPTNPDLTEQSKIAPCTVRVVVQRHGRRDDGAGPGNYTAPPGDTAKGWNGADFNVSPYDFVLGIDVIAYLGGRLAEEGRTCGSPASLRPCTALDVLARGETFVEQHDDRNWAFFYVWEEGPRRRFR